MKLLGILIVTSVVTIYAVDLDRSDAQRRRGEEKIKVDGKFPWGSYPLWKVHKFKGIALRPIALPPPPATVPLPPPPPPPSPSPSFGSPISSYNAPLTQPLPPPPYTSGPSYGSFQQPPQNYDPVYTPTQPTSFPQRFPPQSSYGPSPSNTGYGQQLAAPPSFPTGPNAGPFGPQSQGPYSQQGIPFSAPAPSSVYQSPEASPPSFPSGPNTGPFGPPPQGPYSQQGIPFSAPAPTSLYNSPEATFAGSSGIGTDINVQTPFANSAGFAAGLPQSQLQQQYNTYSQMQDLQGSSFNGGFSEPVPIDVNGPDAMGPFDPQQQSVWAA